MLLGDGLMHVSLVVLSVTILLIALFAYSKKRNARYLFLSIAFFFLTLSQIVNLFESFFSNKFIIIAPLGLHLSHLLDLLMLTSFGLALVRNWGGNRQGKNPLE
jgi:hypothetical protein